jgi:hypothetical protein
LVFKPRPRCEPAKLLSPREKDRTLFVSASIPDPDRWEGEFDALEITDAVVSLARASSPPNGV